MRWWIVATDEFVGGLDSWVSGFPTDYEAYRPGPAPVDLLLRSAQSSNFTS